MRQNVRGLFRRLPHPRDWPRSAYGLVGIMVIIAVGTLASALLIILGKIPNGGPSDPWTAEATIFGIGASLLAVLATGIAVLAYINSTQRPSLRLEALYDARAAVP